VIFLAKACLHGIYTENRFDRSRFPGQIMPAATRRVKGKDLAMPSGIKTTDPFILQNFTNPVVLRVVTIVQNLLENKDFFVKTYGAVLNEIARHYKMPELSDEDIMNIRAKIMPCRLIKGTYSSESVYMQCIPRLKQIHIHGPVSAFYFHWFKFLFLTAVSFFLVA
jgi:hypothetical protein